MQQGKTQVRPERAKAWRQSPQRAWTTDTWAFLGAYEHPHHAATAVTGSRAARAGGGGERVGAPCKAILSSPAHRAPIAVQDALTPLTAAPASVDKPKYSMQ